MFLLLAPNSDRPCRDALYRGAFQPSTGLLDTRGDSLEDAMLAA